MVLTSKRASEATLAPASAPAPAHDQPWGQPYGNAAAAEQLPASEPERGFWEELGDDAQSLWDGVTDGWRGLFSDDEEQVADASAPPTPSDRYRALLARAEAGEDTLPEEARDYVYLNVPGLFTERYPGYMQENLEHLSELGLDVRQVDIDTDASVAANAEAIRLAILEIVEDEGVQVVLTGHSKGGVDLAAALQLYPELVPHVRAVVAMQAPWGGTPLGDLALENETLGAGASWVITELFDGDPRALTDLALSQRAAFNAAHPYPTEVPTVSLATTTDDLSPLGLGASLLERFYGVRTDGLVPEASAALPGSEVVSISGMDHTGPAMDLPFPGRPNPGEIQQALLTMALEQGR